MRIISGKNKGRSLLVPPKFKGRPTTDFAREGVFNVLENRVEWSGLRVLELFAGTGAFGLECASRGCENIWAVELQYLHVDWIKRNHMHFELTQAKVTQQDVFKFIDQYAGSGFDLIFADPPFDHARIKDLPSLINEKQLLAADGLFILEHPKNFNFENEPKYTKTKKYANVCFSFFENQSDSSI